MLKLILRGITILRMMLNHDGSFIRQTKINNQVVNDYLYEQSQDYPQKYIKIQRSEVIIIYEYSFEVYFKIEALLFAFNFLNDWLCMHKYVSLRLDLNVQDLAEAIYIHLINEQQDQISRMSWLIYLSLLICNFLLFIQLTSFNNKIKKKALTLLFLKLAMVDLKVRIYQPQLSFTGNSMHTRVKLDSRIIIDMFEPHQQIFILLSSIGWVTRSIAVICSKGYSKVAIDLEKTCLYVFSYLINLQYQHTHINKMNLPQPFEFNELINIVQIDCLYKKIVSLAQKKYFVQHLGLSTLSPLQVVKLIERNAQKTNIIKLSLNNEEQLLNETFWALNQFKIFTWVSVCYAYLKNKQIQNFNTQDYSFIQSQFSRKSLEFIEYHTKSLIKENKKVRQSWTKQQISFLNDVIKTQKLKQQLSWSEISFQLFVKSEKRFYRTPQKCRQKWFNHLSPQVNRGKWTLQQDLELFNCISQHGLKWALISKKFDGKRTQHMIKNRYNSIVKKSLSKSQKLTSKKLNDKIISEIQKKINLSNYQQRNEESSSQQSQQNQQKQISVGVSLLQGGVVENEKETMIEQKKEEKFNYFEFQEFFNVNKQGKGLKTLQQVQMVQIQMYRYQPAEDEYLNTFLF